MKHIRLFETVADRAAATLNRPYVLYTKETDSLEFMNDDVIIFENSTTKNTLVNMFDRDGDGELTYDEAALVSNEQFAQIQEGSLGSKFNEFQYFTGVTETPDFTERNTVTNLGFGLFKNVIEIVTPPSLRRLGNYSFQVQGNLKVTLNEGLEEIGGGMFMYATASIGKLNSHIPNNTGVNIQNYGGQLIIPSTVTKIGGAGDVGLLGFNARFCVLKLLPTTPPTLIGSIGNSYANHILVPPGTLATYQAAPGWSALADYMAEWVH